MASVDKSLNDSPQDAALLYPHAAIDAEMKSPCDPPDGAPQPDRGDPLPQIWSIPFVNSTSEASSPRSTTMSTGEKPALPVQSAAQSEPTRCMSWRVSACVFCMLHSRFVDVRSDPRFHACWCAGTRRSRTTNRAGTAQRTRPEPSNCPPQTKRSRGRPVRLNHSSGTVRWGPPKLSKWHPRPRANRVTVHSSHPVYGKHATGATVTAPDAL